MTEDDLNEQTPEQMQKVRDELQRRLTENQTAEQYLVLNLPLLDNEQYKKAYEAAVEYGKRYHAERLKEVKGLPTDEEISIPVNGISFKDGKHLQDWINAWASGWKNMREIAAEVIARKEAEIRIRQQQIRNTEQILGRSLGFPEMDGQVVTSEFNVEILAEMIAKRLAEQK